MKWLVVLCITLFTNLLFGQSEVALNIDISDKIIIPKSYIIPRVNSIIKIDGDPEKAWDNAPFTEPFVDIEGVKLVKYQTRTKMLWDDNYLYVYAEIEEPHIWANLKQRDTIIYLNNDFEVFIDPSPSTEAYAEIELNALNTVWDLLLNKPYRVGGYANFHWNMDSLITAVKIHGSINDPTDEDEQWTVENGDSYEAFNRIEKRQTTNSKGGRSMEN